MKKWMVFCLGLVASLPVFGEVDNSKILKDAEVKNLFTAEVKKSVGITFPINRVYHYKDDTGTYYIVLAEDKYEVGSEKGKSKRIKAIQLKASKAGLKKVWEVNDFYLPEAENQETNIGFGTKYCTFSDIDYDGIVDPLLVYGTAGLNDIEDGRLKLIAFYQGKKHVIRHQNSTLDGERRTQVDKAFYDLPRVIRDHALKQMKAIEAEGQSIFPSDWEDKMIDYQTVIQD